MDQPLIRCVDLAKTYDNDGIKTHALHGASFSIQSGEFVAIMGPSGSGKSTLMHLLSFLDRPTGGAYFFRAEDTKTFDDEKLALLRNRNIGFVFQSFNLLPRVSVFENVELPLLYDIYGPTKIVRFLREQKDDGVQDMPRGWMATFFAHMGRKDHDAKVMHALRSVGMEHRRNYLSNQLSGGEKQRVAIARALVNDPDILFADEPTGNLDSRSGLAILATLQELNDKGHTIILVTHERSTAEHAKRLLFMKDGRIVGDEAIAQRRFAHQENTLK